MTQEIKLNMLAIGVMQRGMGYMPKKGSSQASKQAS
jgi:hypothetical protein